MYEFISDSEMIGEIGALYKLVETLASQAEKLTSLREAGKMSDSAYWDVLEELGKRAAFTAQKKNELFSSVDVRIKQINDWIGQLYHDLELLEIRHVIGALPDSKYEVGLEGIHIQLDELEGAKNRIVELIAKIIENLKRVGQHIPLDIAAMPQMAQIVMSQEVDSKYNSK
jgi:hypothetical protein